MSDSPFPALTTAEHVFKDLVWDPMIKAGETWIETEAPVFSAPILKQIEEGTLNEITDYMYSMIVEFIDVTAIRLVNAAHQSAFDHQSLQLKIVAQESGVGSDAYKAQRTKALAALSAFTHFNG